jgi:hypothetical protein
VKKILLLPLLTLFFYVANAQVGINILEPDSSAVLHLESQDRGFLLPRLTANQMNGINNPANGLMVYNVDDSLVYYFNNECWLKVYQKNCRECEFTATVNTGFQVIDRTTTDTAYFEVDITKLNGIDSITTVVLSSLPNGMSVIVENPVVDSVGTVIIKVYANIWATPGNYPLIIQSVCGQNVFFLGVTVRVEPCIIVNIAAPLNDVDLQNDYSIPGVGTPVCVIVNVFNNVEVSSTNTTNFAMTWGNLDPQSHVGLRHEGYIYAKGGDGAPLGNLLSGQFFQNGEDGGDALELTCRTTFDLQGGIYAGGGGGGSVGTSIVLPAISVPLVGTLGPFILLEAGATGGGGSSGGVAQSAAGSGGILLGPSLTDMGTDATVGPNSIPGEGGEISFSVPLSFNVTVITITVTPFVAINGGDGGGFGQPGQPGTGTAGANVTVTATIPFVGNVTLFNQTISGSLGISQGGAAGIAIKTNNNTTQNLITPNFLIKGAVQP